MEISQSQKNSQRLMLGDLKKDQIIQNAQKAKNYIQNVLKDIKQSPKMQIYLNRINMTIADIEKGLIDIIQLIGKYITSMGDDSCKIYAAHVFGKFIIEFLQSKNLAKMDAKERIVWYLEIEIKLGYISQIKEFKNQLDITNTPKSLFQQVWNKIQIEPALNKKKIKKQYLDLKNMLHVATASLISEETHDFILLKKIKFGLSFSKYMLMQSSAKLKSFLFYRTPTLEMAQKIWNMPENGATMQLVKIKYERIKTNIKIYIPLKEQQSQPDIFTPTANSITVRLLSNQSFDTLLVNKQKTSNNIGTIIVHIHGGGFVALSSRSMQIYTRKWCNSLGIPIFSIDYRMPAEHPFPTAPNDCYTVYEFLVNHIHKYLNIQPIKIIIAGDSAGGNLACSLTAMILKNKLLMPIGLYLAYPALSLKMQFSPSRLYSITDPLLWPPMLLLCLKSYLKDNFSNANDPLASPLYLTEQYVNGTKGDMRFPLNWPKTRISVGLEDPLLDDSLLLMQRMVGSEIDCRCVCYEGFSHGYFNTEFIVEESSKTIKDSIKHLEQLVKNK